MISTVIINPQKQEKERIISILSSDRDIEVLALGSDGYDALTLVSSLRPDIAIMDNHLRFIDGEEIPPLLRARSPSTAVIIVASKISDYHLCKAASNDVAGIIHKETDLVRLPRILKCISSGNGYISPSLDLRVLHLLASLNSRGGNANGGAQGKLPAKTQENAGARPFFGENPAGYLSKTEIRVLSQLGKGFASNEIGKNLGLAVGTVRNCISSVMHKTDLQNRAQLVRYAISCGLAQMVSTSGILKKNPVS